MAHAAGEERYIQIIRSLAEEKRPELPSVPERVKSLPGVKAVIFDVYGTLFSSSAGEIAVAEAASNAALLRESCAALGLDIPPPKAEALVSAYRESIQKHHAQRKEAGVPHPEVDIEVIWREALDEVALPSDIDTAALAVEYEMRVNPVWPMPGAAECLSALHESNVPLGIISNAQFYTPLLFPALLGTTVEDIPIHHAQWSYRRGIAKPDISLFQEAKDFFHRSFGYAAEELAYVGNDMLNDIWGASRAGMRSILFAGDRSSLRLRSKDPRVAGLNADAVIRSLRTIEILLGISQ